MANFDNITIFGNTSLSDLFKQIHKHTKDTDKQIEDLVNVLKPMAGSNAGSAVMLMPTIKDLIDVSVKNNDQLIKVAGIAQRAATATSNGGDSLDFINMDEIALLLEEQKAIQEEGQKLLNDNPLLKLEAKK
jgi:hypothetical protein